MYVNICICKMYVHMYACTEVGRFKEMLTIPHDSRYTIFLFRNPIELRRVPWLLLMGIGYFVNIVVDRISLIKLRNKPVLIAALLETPPNNRHPGVVGFTILLWIFVGALFTHFVCSVHEGGACISNFVQSTIRSGNNCVMNYQLNQIPTI